jgi:protein gp37
VPFFFKQWGGITSKANGRVLEGKIWNQFPLNIEKQMQINPILI